MSVMRAAELEKLMKVDTSGWTAKKIQIHEASIETLAASEKVAADKIMIKAELKKI